MPVYTVHGVAKGLGAHVNGFGELRVLVGELEAFLEPSMDVGAGTAAEYRPL